MRHNPSIIAAVTAAVLGLCPAVSQAVIVYQGDGGPGGDGRNTLVPPAAYLTPYNLSGQFGLTTGTPISDRHMLTAAHVSNSPQPFTFQGHTYTFNATPTNVPGTDLRIWTLNTAVDATLFPTWTPLWDASVDGSEVGKEFFVIGRGLPREQAIYTPINPGTILGPVTPASPTTSAIITLTGSATANGSSSNTATIAAAQASIGVPDELRGWRIDFNSYDGYTSWGTNRVDAVQNFDDPTAPISQKLGDFLIHDFDRADRADATEHEAGLAPYDSGGGVFIKSGNVWKLAAVNYGADLNYAATPDGLFDASQPGGRALSVITDLRGLYTFTADGPDPGTELDIVNVGYGDKPIAPYSYSSRISSSRTAILSLIGTAASSGGPGVVVPEPATAIALVAGFAMMARRKR